jgi:hypothetical protein
MTARVPRVRIIVAITALVLGGIGGIGGSMLWMYLRAESEESRADEAVAAAEQLCDQVEDLGWTCVQDPSEIRGEAGPAGPPPSDEAVAEAVADYFGRYPVEDGETPSPAAIAAAVTNYLAEHPPERGEPGPPPSSGQIATAVEDYLTSNPPSPGRDGADGTDGSDGRDGTDGTDGADGEPGRGPTPAEIAAEVEAYLTEHPLPHCPAGSSAEPHTVLTTGGAIDAVVCVRHDTEE